MPRREKLAIAAVTTLAGAAFVFLWTMVPSRGEQRLSPDDVHVLARLDDYTKAAGPGVSNAIPGFLALPGTLGALVDATVDLSAPPASAPPTVDEVSATELLKGFCTVNLPSLVRQQYPGSYDQLTDAELEKRVLDKHPEYHDKVCVLPAWVPAAHDIVKYERVPPGGRWPFAGR